MCINCISLNKIRLENRYPLPRIGDFLDQLQHTKLNMKSRYLEVRVKQEDTWETSFKTRQGLYEWFPKSFVLCNAPTTFMILLNDVLRPYLDSFFIIYLDDILIYMSTWEERISHIMQVLETLKKHQLLANLKKCDFAQKSLLYLGM
jgi:hypothetical protein